MMAFQGFSSEERQRANAFASAFNKKNSAVDKSNSLVPEKDSYIPKNDPEILQKTIDKPTPGKIENQLISEKQPPALKVTDQEPENNIEVTEDKSIKAIHDTEKFSTVPADKKIRIRSKHLDKFILVMILLLFSFSLYTFQELQEVSTDQKRILENQRILFDKLSRLGKRRYR
jgi:hypothetical protein